MNKLIISLTSWPKRINMVAKTIVSLLQQNVDKSLYHIVLVLCDKEFPNKENDLPIDLITLYKNNYFEIIWTPTNTFSHKKLMPTLIKYSNNPILVCDEDILRPNDWLSYFIKDHKKYPTDILVGGCVFDIEFNNNIFNPIAKCYFDKNEFAGKIIINRRPANGYGGVLYPVNTFLDKRFYDENLYMKLTPHSDESWQFCFNVIENRTLRWISKIFPLYKYEQKLAYETSMSKMRDKDKTMLSYNQIYNNLFKEFPEFEEKLRERLK